VHVLTVVQNMYILEISLINLFPSPWESEYLWFIVPGIITWIGATLWWFKNKSKWLPVILQGIGAFEVALGGVAGYLAGISAIPSVMEDSETFDPFVDAVERACFSQVALIGFGIHWVVLIGTIVTMIFTHRRKLEHNKSHHATTGSGGVCDDLT